MVEISDLVSFSAANRGTQGSAVTSPDEPSATVRRAPAIVPSTRPADPRDPAFLTVEPDGRDDIGFQDRLRHKIEAVFGAVQSGDALTDSVARALEAIREPLDAVKTSGEAFFVQIRAVSAEVSFAENAETSGAFASYRQIGIEIGVARAQVVNAGDVRVLDLEGRSLSLTLEETQAGFTSGRYRTLVTGGQELDQAARDRLEAAQTGLARVKAVQDALNAYRKGDIDPLNTLIENGRLPGFEASRSTGAVFPGVGALPFS